MRQLNLFLLLALFLTVSVTVQAQSYTLVWSDEFLGSTINPNNWTHEIGGGGWGNNELQYYTDRADNSYIQNGKLVIEAKEESFGGRDYTSARLITKGKQFFKYGRIEARIKLPYGQGLWPAFWMLGENISSIGWPACGEIDIMEMIGGTNNDHVVHGTLHWEFNGHAQFGNQYVLSSGIFADDYHVFTIEWNPQTIKWFVDGNSYLTIDITGADKLEFHENFFILFNVAVGGNWPGSPNSSTVFPQKMYVDYVRVYKNTDAIPTISMVTPSDNSLFTSYENITLTADVQFQGNLQAVNFYQGEKRIGTTDIEPYSMTWRNVSPGCYKITVDAITEDGYVGESQTINIQVGESCVDAPYSGNPILIPGSVEVENFNLGEPNSAFYDTDIVNSGGDYRLFDQVDIETCSDENGGYNIGWTETGEWMNYFIEVEETGTYIIEPRVASENSSGAFRIEFDGENKTGTMAVPNTGGWQQWTTISSNPVSLNAGIYTIKVYIETGSFNLNRIDIYPPNAQPKLNLIYPSGGETLGKGTIQEIRWRAILVDDVSIGFTTNGGQSWDFITQSTTCEFGVYRWLVPDITSNDCYIMIKDQANSNIRDTSSSAFTIDFVNSVDKKGELNYNFNLGQNYPNPFNPSTNIKFSVPDGVTANLFQNHVRLVIYDVLGKEVALLVDESKSPGTYEVEWNAESLSSGVYFYELKMGSLSSIKKMILQK